MGDSHACKRVSHARQCSGKSGCTGVVRVPAGLRAGYEGALERGRRRGTPVPIRAARRRDRSEKWPTGWGAAIAPVAAGAHASPCQPHGPPSLQIRAGTDFTNERFHAVHWHALMPDHGGGCTACRALGHRLAPAWVRCAWQTWGGRCTQRLASSSGLRAEAQLPARPPLIRESRLDKARCGAAAQPALPCSTAFGQSSDAGGHACRTLPNETPRLNALPCALCDRNGSRHQLCMPGRPRPSWCPKRTRAEPLGRR